MELGLIGFGKTGKADANGFY